MRAAGGRPVTQDQIEAITAWIAAEVHRQGPEIGAERIGDLAERGLARVDPVSAIQFASVYRNLADLDELEAVVRRFKDDPLPGEDQLAIEGSVPSEPESIIGRSRKVSSQSKEKSCPTVVAPPPRASPHAVPGLEFRGDSRTSDKHPFDCVEWEIRDALIGDPADPAFEQRGVEFPVTWSQNATNIVAQKYFRGRLGQPERESSVKQMIGRVAGTIAGWGREGGYFASDDDAAGLRG